MPDEPKDEQTEKPPKPSLLELLASFEPLDEDIPEIEDFPAEPFDL